MRGSFRCSVHLNDIRNIFGIIAVCGEKLQVPGKALNEHVLHTSVVASTRTCDFVGINVIVRCGMGHIFMVWFSGSHVHDTTCTHD